MISKFVLLTCVLGYQDSSPPPDVLCGSYCLFVALDAIGKAPPKFQDLESALGAPGTAGYSMAQLQKGAEQFGAKTLAVQTTLENLRDRGGKFACLTHAHDDHFILLYDVTDTRVAIVDPPRDYELTRAAFQPTWGRKALLISAEPLRSEESIVWMRRLRVAGLWTLGLVVASAILGLARSRLRRRRVAAVALLTASSGLFFSGCRPVDAGPDLASKSKFKEVAAGPDIRPFLTLFPEHVELGRILRSDPSRTADAKAVIRNDGDSDVFIRKMTTSCDCTRVTVDHRLLKPGGTATVHATIRLGDTPEVRTTRISIDTTDPVTPFHELLISWQPQNPLVTDPISIDLPQLAPGDIVEKSLAIRLEGFSLCERCRLDALPQSKLLACDLERREVPRLGHGDSRIGTMPLALGDLRIRLASEDEEVHHREMIAISLTCGEEVRARSVVPVAWSVTPPIKASPPRLSLGRAKPGQVFHQKIIMRALRGGRFRLLPVTEPDPAGLIEIESDQAADLVHVVNVAVTAPNDGGIWRSSVRIATDHPEAGLVEIPISGLIDDGR
jgi:hypothetical protein